MPPEPFAERSSSNSLDDDRQTLNRLGYAQQLFREMGGFSNFAVSFSVISILTGTVLLFGYGLRYGGPAINTIGWPIVSVFVLCVAASMAELTSAYPTAGGLYYWSFRLGGRRWAWTCAWLNMMGQVTITAGINAGAAAYATGLVTGLLGVAPDARVPLLGAVNGWNFWMFAMALLMIPQVILNARGIGVTAALSRVSLVWHIAGVIILVAALTLLGRHNNPASFLLSTAHPSMPLGDSMTFKLGPLTVNSIFLRLAPLRALYASGVYPLCFVLGLLQAQWTYTGYDASAHLAEETRSARMNSAWGVFLSVAVSAIAGYAALLALTIAIPPGRVAETANDPYPVLFIVRHAIAPFLANLIAVIIAGAMWLCGLASITSMARMWFAFARDGGFPGSEAISRIDPRTRTPTIAIVVTSALAFLITIYSAAYSVVTSISTTALYLAYAIPIYLNWRNRRHGSGEFATSATAPWSLGRLSPAINLIGLIWVAFITILFSIPPNELAGWTMLALGAFMLVYWRLVARRRFVGPRAMSAQEIERLEAAAR